MRKGATRAGALMRRAARAGLPVVVAAALATALLGYYGFLGMRYWKASRQVATATAEVERLSGLVETYSGAEASVAEAGGKAESRLDELRTVFQARPSDELVSLLATTAQKAGVGLKSVTGGEPVSLALEGMQFLAQSIGITLQGSTVDIYRFLTLLQREAPAMGVGDVRIVGAEFAPSAQVQLVFYSLPAGEAAQSGAQSPSGIPR